MNKLLLVFALITSLNVHSQATWQKTFGGIGTEDATKIILTSNNDILILGNTTSFGAGGTDAVLLSINSVGDTLWTKTYGGNGYDYGFDLKETTNGDLLISGTTDNVGQGMKDAWLMKVDISGNVIWSKTYGGGNDEWAYQVTETPVGYLLVGTTHSYGQGIDDIYCVHTDFNGNVLWTKTLGGNMANRGYFAIVTENGNLLIGGNERNTQGGSWSNYMASLDLSGNLLFQSSSKGPLNDLPNIATYDGEEFIYHSGYGTGYIGGDDGYLSKRDTLGNVSWTKLIGGTQGDYLGEVIIDTANNELLVVGATSTYTNGVRDMFFVKTNLNGDTLWTKHAGGTGFDQLNEVINYGDGTFIAIGRTNSYGNGDYDIIMVKERLDGNFLACNWGYCNPTVQNITANISGSLGQSSGGIITNYSPTLTIGTDETGVVCFNCPTSSGTDFQTACDTYTWMDGITYTSSTNTPTWTLTNAAGCDSVVTLDLTINYSNTGTDVQTACNTYTWIDGITYTSSTNTPTWTLTNAAGCDSVVTLDLTINPMPDVNVTQLGSLLTSDQVGATYQWLDCDDNNAVISGETNQSFTPTPITGNYAVEVNLNGCVDTSTCYLLDYTGLSDLYANVISIHPNPTSDVLMISGLDQIIGLKTIEVFSSKGEIVTKFKGVENKINVSDLPTGVYFLNINHEAGVETIRFVKE